MQLKLLLLKSDFQIKLIRIFYNWNANLLMGTYIFYLQFIIQLMKIIYAY